MEKNRSFLLLIAVVVSGSAIISAVSAQDTRLSETVTSVQSLQTEDLDLSGHWQGSPQNSANDMGISIDIHRETGGTYTGAFSQLSEGLSGLLLNHVGITGHTVEIVVREDQPFVGELSADSQRIDGALHTMGFEIPIVLVRTGPPEITTKERIAAVDSFYTGIWIGALGATQIELRIDNHTDGTASAEFINITDGRLRIPADTIAAENKHLSIGLPAINGLFTGYLGEDGNSIDGIYSQGANKLSMTFVKLK